MSASIELDHNLTTDTNMSCSIMQVFVGCDVALFVRDILRYLCVLSPWKRRTSHSAGR